MRRRAGSNLGRSARSRPICLVRTVRLQSNSYPRSPLTAHKQKKSSINTARCPRLRRTARTFFGRRCPRCRSPSLPSSSVTRSPSLPSSPVAVVDVGRRRRLRVCSSLLLRLLLPMATAAAPMQPTILVASCSLKMHSRVAYNQKSDASKYQYRFQQNKHNMEEKKENGASVPAKNLHRCGTKNMKHRFQQKHDMVEAKTDTGCSKIKTPIAKK